MHYELRLLLESGLTPLAAIRIATLNAAKVLGKDEEFGTIRPGLRADIVMVAGDPSTDIGALAATELVLRDGKRYDPEQLRATVMGRIQ